MIIYYSGSITVSLSTQSTSVVYGSGVLLTATITSEVPLNLSSTIKWLKGRTGGSFTEFYLTLSKYIQNDVGVDHVTLTIQSVNFDDTRAHQMVASNIAATTSKSNQVSITVAGSNRIKNDLHFHSKYVFVKHDALNYQTVTLIQVANIFI